MRCACIDIGSNTTRLLVADVTPHGLRKVEERRIFTHLRRALDADGRLAPDTIAALVSVIDDQLRVARALGAERVRAVATAAIRRAVNAADLVSALADSCHVALRVLGEPEEARFAFIGAAAALRELAREPEPGAPLGVIDVGGGSSEVVIGTPPDVVAWSTSLPLGSGDLSDACVHEDPPSDAEVAAVQRRIEGTLAALEIPRPARAVAVGGSAASLQRLAGAPLDGERFAAALALLQSASAGTLASQFGLDVERVRLLCAGVLILRALHDRLGVALELVGGGLREGVILELGR